MSFMSFICLFNVALSASILLFKALFCISILRLRDLILKCDIKTKKGDTKEIMQYTIKIVNVTGLVKMFSIVSINSNISIIDSPLCMINYYTITFVGAP